MKNYRDNELLKRFGKNLTLLREKVDLSSKQMQYATGISSSNIDGIETGKINTSLSQAARLSDFFGLQIEDVIAVNFKCPSNERLEKNIDEFLRKKGIDPKTFVTKGLAGLIRKEVLKSNFLKTPRYTVDIAGHLKEKFGVEFTTTAISQTMENLRKDNLIEKIPTDKKSKFRYTKK